MGEWSKLVGERGEEIVLSFLKLVGHNPEKGVSLSCTHSNKHALKQDSPRTTHGIDYFASYKCPLQKDSLEILNISSKYTDNGYKSNPKSEFKSFFTDLSHTIECFKRSPKRNEVQSNYKGKGISNVHETGVLFYLSNKQDDLYADVISRLSDSTLPQDLVFDKVFVMDNNRVSFVFEAMDHAKKIADNIHFVYHDSGLIINTSESLNIGTFLPVQYFNSPILLLRLEQSGEISLFIALNDSFNESNLKRLIGLAQKLNNLANKTILAFPNYNKLTHEQQAAGVLSVFADSNFANKILIQSYRTNFTNQL